MTTDGRLLRGEHTRRLILTRSMDIASSEGLEGLSIGRLATDLGISKSGLFAHFGSKEELQLATYQAAREAFVERVVTPARKAPPGIRRVEALIDSWLAYVETRVFPGGCIIYAIAAEFDSRPGRIRDAIAAAVRDWESYLEHTIARAVDLGELAEGTDVPQLAWELHAYVWNAVGTMKLYDSADPARRARRAMRDRLAVARP